jgi:uncharacterized protein
MARFLIVDGHSAIFSWPELGELHRRRMVLARDALIQKLTQYQDASGVRVVVVFDGQGQTRSAEASEPGGIQVFYSGSGVTADGVLERLAAAYGHTHDLMVATNDLAEQDTVAGFGATCISTEVMRGMIDAELDNLQRDIKKHRRQ